MASCAARTTNPTLAPAQGDKSITTLTLDDKLAEQLTRIADAQGKTLDTLATETLRQLAEAAQPAAPQAALPVPEPTEGERLLAFLKPHWDAQTANPAHYQPAAPPQSFRDLAEETLWKHWADDLRQENSP